MRSALAVIALAAVVSCASAATAAVRDDSILNETQFFDATSDATGGGADLSSLTVTTYTDGTVSFAVQFANRDFLHPGETAQIFIDLNNDKTDDLNLSIWPTADPSYLDHWGGSDWVDVRQLPELVETKGGFSVRLVRNDLQGAAGMQAASSIGVRVGTWTVADTTTNKFRDTPDDFLPNDNSHVEHQMTKPPVAPPPTEAPPSSGHAGLAVKCSGHALVATLRPAKGSKVASVSFSAGGNLRAVDRKAPFVATIPTKTKAPLTLKAVVHLVGGRSQTLATKTTGC